jgi:hypothetical protein
MNIGNRFHGEPKIAIAFDASRARPLSERCEHIRSGVTNVRFNESARIVLVVAPDPTAANLQAGPADRRSAPFATPLQRVLQTGEYVT